MLTSDIIDGIDTAIDALLEGNKGFYDRTISRIGEEAGNGKCKRLLRECLMGRARQLDGQQAELLCQEAENIRI